MLSRRQLLQGLALSSGASLGVGGYAVAEPHSLIVRTFKLTPPRWPAGLRLRLALLTDVHACDPWMSVERIASIVERTNRLAPDVVLLLGDFVAGSRMLRFARYIPERDWAQALAGLRAPLGVHAVLGNHDWWDDHEVQQLMNGPPAARTALEAEGIPVYENDAVRLFKSGQAFWIAGLGDQAAFWPGLWRGAPPPHRPRHYGVDDLDGTLLQVSDDAPVIMMAHEPDIFERMPGRVALTVCGHTHGGQVRFPGLPVYVPSQYGSRYIHGHIVEGGRNLIVSSGLGCSGIPVRLGVPPEIVIVELGAGSAEATS